MRVLRVLLRFAIPDKDFFDDEVGNVDDVLLQVLVVVLELVLQLVEFVRPRSADYPNNATSFRGVRLTVVVG